MTLLTANVTLEIDSFPCPDKQIFVHPMHCTYKDNRPPATDPLKSPCEKGGNELGHAAIPVI